MQEQVARSISSALLGAHLAATEVTPAWRIQVRSTAFHCKALQSSSETVAPVNNHSFKHAMA
jgi:hypothetical protein